MSFQYSAYGSNMFSKWLQDRCPSAHPKAVACVDDRTLMFSKRSIDGSGKATISRAEGQHVFGVIFTLEERDRPALDNAEGAGKGYDRLEDFLVHEPSAGKPERVLTYIANATHIDSSLEPYDWYIALVLARAREHSLPAEYVSVLENVPPKLDPKPHRISRLIALRLLGTATT